MRFKIKMDLNSWIALFLPLVLTFNVTARGITVTGIIMGALAILCLLMFIIDRIRAVYIIEEEHLVTVGAFGKSKLPYSNIERVIAEYRKPFMSFKTKERFQIDLDMGKKHLSRLHPKNPEAFWEELKKQLKEEQYAL